MLRFAVGVLVCAGCATGGQAIVNRAVEAVGGRERLEAVEGYRIESRVFTLAATGGDVEEYFGFNTTAVETTRDARVLPQMLDGKAERTGPHSVAVGKTTYEFDAGTGLLRTIRHPGRRVEVSDWRRVDGILVAHRIDVFDGPWPQERRTVTSVAWGPVEPPEPLPPMGKLPVTLYIEEQPEQEIASTAFDGDDKKLAAWLPKASLPVTVGPDWIHEATKGGAKREAFQFAFYRYQGTLEGCRWLFPRLNAHVRVLGSRPTGAPRIIIESWDASDQTCRALVGVPIAP